MGKLDEINIEIDILMLQLYVLEQRLQKQREIAEKSIIKKIFRVFSKPYRMFKDALKQGSILKIVATGLFALLATITLICPIMTFFEKAWDNAQDDKKIVLQNQKFATELRINELTEQKKQILETDSTNFNEEYIRNKAILQTISNPSLIDSAQESILEYKLNKK